MARRQAVIVHLLALQVALGLATPAPVQADSNAPNYRVLKSEEVLASSVADADAIALISVHDISTGLIQSPIDPPGALIMATTIRGTVKRYFKSDARAPREVTIRSTEATEDLLLHARQRPREAIVFMRQVTSPDSALWPYVQCAGANSFKRGAILATTQDAKTLIQTLPTIVRSQDTAAMAAEADLIIEGSPTAMGPRRSDGSGLVPTVQYVNPTIVAGTAPDTILVTTVIPGGISRYPAILFLRNNSGNVYTPIGVSAGVVRLDGKQPGRRGIAMDKFRTTAKREWHLHHGGRSQ